MHNNEDIVKNKQKPFCNHIRIRDDNDYNINIESLIKWIEKELKIDFRSLPRWQELIKRLHISRTDCNKKIQYAKFRKAEIIQKLYIQSSRKSPFQLTAELARTSSKWRRIEHDIRVRKFQTSPVCTHDEAVEEETAQEYTPHPNTEDSEIEALIEYEPSRIDARTQRSTLHVTPSLATLPVVIYTNPHKLISPLNSQTRPLSYHDISDHIELPDEDEIKAWQPSSSAVICKPNPIVITNNTLKQQFVIFSLINRTGEYLHIRYKCITDDSPFKNTKILPIIPKILYPGIPVVYKFLFKLKNKEIFETGIFFKVGKYINADVNIESFLVPIVSAFVVKRDVTVTDTIIIPSVYPWHIKMGPNTEYPSGTVKIFVNDQYSYHLHIHKRIIDLSRDSEILSSNPSTQIDSVIEDNNSFNSSKSFEQTKHVGHKVFNQSQSLVQISGKSATSPKGTDNTVLSSKNMDSSGKRDDEHSNYTDIISTIINDIVQLALETFLFESSYMYLQPYTKTAIPIYFTKCEHTGYHQSYYDLELIDSETDTVVMVKTVKVFAEVLAHPIQVAPPILDMSKSPITHGYYNDRFIITNNHKIYPVTIHIKLTTKMKQIFCVTPMKSLVPTESSVELTVNFCSRDTLSVKPSEDLVHFTFKIILTGYKTVYQNVPPIFYELIAPCAMQFKNVYNEKYFKDAE